MSEMLVFFYSQDLYNSFEALFVCFHGLLVSVGYLRNLIFLKTEVLWHLSWDIREHAVFKYISAHFFTRCGIQETPIDSKTR